MARKARNPHAHTNPDLHRATIERARSNAAGTMADRRTRRNRDRASQRRNAIREAAY